jgi:hypothetical protein
MKLFAPVQRENTTLNGEQNFGSYPTDNTKHMDFEVHSGDGISG